MGSFWAELGSNVLLFFLVFGMSATVELRALRKQMNNSTALLIGVCMQFLILPFIGFLVVKALNLPAAMGITLLVVTSSPGGSYSNWWCSLFNAELSLSVTMTAISTLLSTVMLPTNLILYARWTYSSAVVKSLDWSALVISLVVVLSGISCGLLASARAKAVGMSSRFHRRANLLGNFAGISLITLSVSVSSSDHHVSLWSQDALFYIGVALPACLGLAIATYLASKMDLQKPERVAVAVESCYQNTGIATSVALTMFSENEDELATAIGVPLLYGMMEAVLLAMFCMVCWKMGWTKAPANENMCVVLYNSYEVDEEDREEMEEAIEVVLGAAEVGGTETAAQADCSPSDLIFAQTEDGSYAVDKLTLDKATASNEQNHHHHPRRRQQQFVIDDDDHTEQDMTEISLDNHHHPHHAHGILQDTPSSPTVSSRSSHDDGQLEDEEGIVVEPNQQDAAATTMRLDLEEGADCLVVRDGQQQQPATTGRLGRTISTLRARATGYVQAPVPPTSPDDSEEPSSPAPSTKGRGVVAMDERHVVRRLVPLSTKDEDEDDEEQASQDHRDDHDYSHNNNDSSSSSSHNDDDHVPNTTPTRQAKQKTKSYHAIPVASPDVAVSSLRKTIVPATGKQLD